VIDASQSGMDSFQEAKDILRLVIRGNDQGEGQNKGDSNFF
jgi:hypothetical protein